MAKKATEEFNPWPPFVDIFSSTILVLLLFMLILVVNLGYYAQFKFKVSYAGTITTNRVIVKDNKKIDKMKKEQKEQKKQKEVTPTVPVLSKPIIVQKTSIIKSEDEERKELERAGQDFVQTNNQKTTQQKTVEKDDYLVINFAEKEILLDDPTIIKIKEFIKKVKSKFKKHKIIVSSVEPSNQISATVSRQISLARTLNVRNLVRKQEYKKSDVRVRLLEEKIRKQIPKNVGGYVYISVKVNK